MNRLEWLGIVIPASDLDVFTRFRCSEYENCDLDLFSVCIDLLSIRPIAFSSFVYGVCGSGDRF